MFVQPANVRCPKASFIVAAFLQKQWAAIDFYFPVAEASFQSSSMIPVLFPKDVCFSLLIPPGWSEQDEASFRVNNPVLSHDVFSSACCLRHIGFLEVAIVLHQAET